MAYTLKEIVCPVCMEKFVPKSYRQETCPKCKKKIGGRRKTWCMECGKVFMARSRTQLYCSAACRQKAARNRKTSSNLPAEKPAKLEKLGMKKLDRMSGDDLRNYGKIQAQKILSRGRS